MPTSSLEPAASTTATTEPQFPMMSDESVRSEQTENQGVRFVIRVDSAKERQKAIKEFDLESEAPQKQLKEIKLPALPQTSSMISNAEFLKRHHEREMAKVLLRETLNLEPRHPLALAKMVDFLPNDRDHREEKFKVAKAYDAVAGTPAAAFEMARLYYEMGELDLALESYFRAANRIDEENEMVFEIYKDIGNIFVRQKDFDGAEEYYHKAFALNPDSDTLQVNLGTLEIQREDWAEACLRFRAALGSNAKNDRAWVGLALTHHQMGDIDLAFANLINAIDLNPTNRTAVHLLAAWGQKFERQTEAIEGLQTYLAQGEVDEDMSLALIELFCEKKDFALAQLELTRLMAWKPEREDLYELEIKLAELAQGEVQPLSTAVGT